MEGIAEYKCPACGGAVKFDSASQKLKCPYCDTEFDIGEILRAKEDDAKERKDSISWDSSGAEWDESETQGILV